MASQHKIGSVATAMLRDERGTLRVVYHSTAVVTVEASGKITLDHGGWRTSTTKTRMNQAANQLGLGFSVFQKDHAWYVAVRGREGVIDFDTTPCVIYDPAAVEWSTAWCAAWGEIGAAEQLRGGKKYPALIID